MLFAAKVFNQNIGNWKTGRVTNMQNMFDGASAFNQDIGDWDTSSVENMSSMLEGAISFDQDLSEWCVGSVISYDRFDTGISLNPAYLPPFGTQENC